MHSHEVHSNLYRVRMAVIVSGFVLLIGGMVMIFMDLKSEGTIAIKSPFISGSINATYIGLMVIFFGVLLEVVAVSKSFNNKEKVEITTHIEKAEPKPEPKRLDTPEKLWASREVKGRVATTSKTPKKATTAEQELKKMIEQALDITLPAQASLDDPEVTRLINERLKSLGQPTLNLERPVLNKETFSYRSETTGARLASSK